LSDTKEPSGNIKTWTQETDVSAAKVYDFEYDRADQLTAATLKTTDPTPTVLKRYVYGYDPAGNRTSEQIDNGVTSALHNNMNQTHTLQPGGMLRLAGTTNEAANVTIGGQQARILPGNRFEGETPVGSGTTSVPVVATDGSGNQRTYTYDVSVSGSTKTLTYDPNGNLISDGQRTYEWDALNRLTRVLEGGNELVRYVYDAEGRRVQKIAGGATHTYVYDGHHAVEERLSTGEVRRFFRGRGVDNWLGQQDSTGSTYLVANHLGSVVAQTSAAGQPVVSRSYDPWGNMDAGATQPGHAFTGREWDSESHLYYYRA
jgi:YD repeat-containing protein